MIRLITLDSYEEKDVAELCKQLFQAYGLGCEHGGDLPLPAEALDSSGAYHAALLLAEAEAVKSFADDKLLYVTRQKLLQPRGPTGVPPTYGFAQFGGERCVVSTATFAKLADLSEEFQKRLAKQAIHEMGHLWELHTCLDPKCAMHPPWTEAFETNVEPQLCTFCREKSENKIRLAKS